MVDKYTHIKGRFVFKCSKRDYVPPAKDKSILKLFIYLRVSISINGAVIMTLSHYCERKHLDANMMINDYLEPATCQSLSVKLFV